MGSPNPNDIVISANNISKIYKLYRSPTDRLKESLHPARKPYHKEFYALKNINLQVKRGEILGVVGRNGSGKSTLLKILSKVLTPSKGDYIVKGNLSSLLELGAGFNPELTGIENVYFYATILGFSEERIKSKLVDILDFADIGDFVYQPLKTYSSGMRARLAFAVAINVDPSVLILDEVLAVGDELFRRKCYARMESFFKGGKTILFVSHSISSINQLCTRAVMLDKGELILDGPTKLVTSQYERFLFAKTENMAQVREEIVLMNKDEKLKEATYAEIESAKKQKNTVPASIKPETTVSNAKTEKQAESITKPKAYYLPGLVPKSTVEYRNEDVDITDVCIHTLEGEKVNVLITGEKYIYSYKATFNCDAENVIFGMKIKTEIGLEINGTNTRRLNNIISKIKKGEIYIVNWEFRCNLLQGTYYTNAGVASLMDNDFVLLSRIIDSSVFRVLFLENKPYAHLVYLEQYVKILRSE